MRLSPTIRIGRIMSTIMTRLLCVLFITIGREDDVRNGRVCK